MRLSRAISSIEIRAKSYLLVLTDVTKFSGATVR